MRVIPVCYLLANWVHREEKKKKKSIFKKRERIFKKRERENTNPKLVTWNLCVIPMWHLNFHLCCSVPSLFSSCRWLLKIGGCSWNPYFAYSWLDFLILSLKIWMAKAFGFETLGLAICQYLYIEKGFFFFLYFKRGIFLQRKSLSVVFLRI